MPVIIAWNRIRTAHLLSDGINGRREGRASARPHRYQRAFLVVADAQKRVPPSVQLTNLGLMFFFCFC